MTKWKNTTHSLLNLFNMQTRNNFIPLEKLLEFVNYF